MHGSPAGYGKRAMAVAQLSTTRRKRRSRRLFVGPKGSRTLTRKPQVRAPRRRGAAKQQKARTNSPLASGAGASLFCTISLGDGLSSLNYTSLSDPQSDTRAIQAVTAVYYNSNVVVWALMGRWNRECHAALKTRSSAECRFQHSTTFVFKAAWPINIILSTSSARMSKKASKSISPFAE
jgi:hypothetical protein